MLGLKIVVPAIFGILLVPTNFFLVGALENSINDLNFNQLFENPDQYTDIDVDITGKIFHLIPASVGIKGVQIYQGGDRNRDVVIRYDASNNFGPFTEDECVSVNGTSSGSFDFTNAFGATISAPLIDADSIAKIDCGQVINPAQNVVNIEQSQVKSGVKVTLHKVEFTDKNVRAFLTVENNNKNTEIKFYDFNSKALQGNRQFETTYDYDVDYPKIESDIPAGIVEDGVIIFEPMSVSQDSVKFEFQVSKNFNDIKFTFDVIPTSNNENQIASNSTEALVIDRGGLTKQDTSTSNEILPNSNTNQRTNSQSSGARFSFLETWGTPGSGRGQLEHPASIDTDKDGQRFYIADLDNNRVQVVDKDGKFINTWGSLGKGEGQFNNPGSIALDDRHKIVFVADIRNNRIEKFDTNGNFIAQWGSLGRGEGQFDHPGDIALDPDEEILYVTDIYNNRIQAFYYDGNFVTKWGLLGTGDGQFNRPAGIAIDPESKRVFVSDTVNNRIQVFDTEGKFISKWGSMGISTGQFQRPDGIHFEPSGGLLYVADRQNHRIQVFSSEGSFVSQWMVSDAKSGKTIKPRDVAMDSSGQIYIVDKENNRVVIYKGVDGLTPTKTSYSSQVIGTSNEQSHGTLQYNNSVMSIKFSYPAEWIFAESPDKLAVKFSSNDEFSSFQIKAVKLPSSNFSLSEYILRYLNLLRDSSQTISINETKKIPILGSDGFSLLYNKEIDSVKYSVLQDFVTSDSLLYVFTFTAPTEKFPSSLTQINEVVDSSDLLVRPNTGLVKITNG